MNLEKENTVKIDTTTGLPQLPEGYFWEVCPYEFEARAGATGRESRWLTTAGYEVCIMTPRTTTTTTTKERWWDKVEVKTETKNVSVKSKRLIDPEKYAAAVEQKNAYYASVSYWGGGYNFFSDTHYTDITPEIVLEAAKELYVKWQADLADQVVAKAKREASKALVGVYPPKALSV